MDICRTESVTSNTPIRYSLYPRFSATDGPSDNPTDFIDSTLSRDFQLASSILTAFQTDSSSPLRSLLRTFTKPERQVCSTRSVCSTLRFYFAQVVLAAISSMVEDPTVDRLSAPRHGGRPFQSDSDVGELDNPKLLRAVARKYDIEST